MTIYSADRQQSATREARRAVMLWIGLFISFPVLVPSFSFRSSLKI